MCSFTGDPVYNLGLKLINTTHYFALFTFFDRAGPDVIGLYNECSTPNWQLSFGWTASTAVFDSSSRFTHIGTFLYMVFCPVNVNSICGIAKVTEAGIVNKRMVFKYASNNDYVYVNYLRVQSFNTKVYISFRTHISLTYRIIIIDFASD